MFVFRNKRRILPPRMSLSRHAPILVLSLLAAATARAAPDTYSSQVLPVLKQYCWDCHGDGKDKGDLNLDRFATPAAILKEPKV